MGNLEQKVSALLAEAVAVPLGSEDVFQRLQFVSRVLREARVATTENWLLWFDSDKRLTGIPVVESVLVGRDADCGIRLADPRISRRHVEIRSSSRGDELRDLESSNGTFVNGARVDRRVLRDGDVIEVGGVAIVYFSKEEPSM